MFAACYNPLAHLYDSMEKKLLISIIPAFHDGGIWSTLVKVVYVMGKCGFKQAVLSGDRF